MEELVMSLKEYLSPELVFMIPVLIVIGNVLKRSKRVSDSLIPSLLSGIGIPLALIVSLANKYEPMSTLQIITWILMSIGQGIFLGASAVGVHQIFKQQMAYSKLSKWEEKENLIKEIREEMEEDK